VPVADGGESAGSTTTVCSAVPATRHHATPGGGAWIGESAILILRSSIPIRIPIHDRLPNHE
jgi:hypothetical protein